MLEGLDRINWSDLTHAYGSAEDVPDLLRDLASTDEETAGEALEALGTSIYHQGTVYEATAHAVPFLIELVRESSVRQRDWLLDLLRLIARGNSYLEQHKDFEPERSRWNTPELQEQRARELGWVAAARDAVAAGIPVYRSLLDSEDEAIREAAGKVLDCFEAQG
jgi:hypothetical protein